MKWDNTYYISIKLLSNLSHVVYCLQLQNSSHAIDELDKAYICIFITSYAHCIDSPKNRIPLENLSNVCGLIQGSWQTIEYILQFLSYNNTVACMSTK